MLFAGRGRLLPAVALVLFAGLPEANSQTAEQVRKSQQARQLMAESRFADAVPLYSELVTALPQNIGLRLNLALALHMSGQHKQAVPEFERVLKATPSSLPALLSLGASYLELQQPEPASAALQKVVDLQPDHVPARGMLANALLTLNRPDKALPHFRKLTALSTADPKAWYGLKRCYEALAGVAFEELNRTASGSAEWLAIVGDSRFERGQYRSAFYFYKQALARKPELSHAYAGMAEVYRSTGHAEWAPLAKAKMSKPDCARDKEDCAFSAARLNEVTASPNPYWRTRAYNELARKAYARLEALPLTPERNSLKAEHLLQTGKPQHAVDELRAAAKLAPSDYRIARQLAVALHEARDYDAALPALERILREEPDAPDIQYYLGDSWLQKADPDKAIVFLEASIRLAPEALGARAALGTAYSRMGRHSDAIPHLTAALSIDDDGSLHYQLSRALQATSENDRAQAMLAKYKELNERSEGEKRKLESEASITAP